MEQFNSTKNVLKLLIATSCIAVIFSLSNSNNIAIYANQEQTKKPVTTFQLPKPSNPEKKYEIGLHEGNKEFPYPSFTRAYLRCNGQETLGKPTSNVLYRESKEHNSNYNVRYSIIQFFDKGAIVKPRGNYSESYCFSGDFLNFALKYKGWHRDFAAPTSDVIKIGPNAFKQDFQFATLYKINNKVVQAEGFIGQFYKEYEKTLGRPINKLEYISDEKGWKQEFENGTVFNGPDPKNPNGEWVNRIVYKNKK
jgi:hypothetical protein